MCTGCLQSGCCTPWSGNKCVCCRVVPAMVSDPLARKCHWLSILPTACLHLELSAATRCFGTNWQPVWHSMLAPRKHFGCAGLHLVSGCEGGVITVWSPDHGIPLHTLREHTADITAVEWCPQASLPQQQHLLATAAQDHSVRCVFAKYCSGTSCCSLQPTQLCSDT